MLKQSIFRLAAILIAVVVAVLLVWLIIQSTQNTKALKHIEQGITTLNHDEIIMTQNLQQISKQTSQWQQQDQQSNATELQQIKQSNQQFNSTLHALQQQLDQLRTMINTLPVPAIPPQTTTKIAAAQPTRQTATGYHIYAVEPYGVVIGTPSGEFHIVRVGEVIPMLGQVESISADQVLVGQRYVIRASH